MCFAMGWGPGPLASVGRLGRWPEISARPVDAVQGGDFKGRGWQGRMAGPQRSWLTLRAFSERRGNHRRF